MHHDHIRNGTGTPIATAIRIAAGMIPAEDLTLLDFLRREIKDDLGVEVDEVLDVVELVSASDKDSPLLACTLSTSEGAVLRAGPKGHLLDIFWLNKEMMKARDDDKVNGGLMGGFVQYAEERGIVARLQEKRRGSIAAAAKTQAVVAKRKSLPRSSKGSVKRRAKK